IYIKLYREKTMYSKIVTLRFPRKIVNEPIVVNLVRKFDLTFNILKATIYPRKEGLMVLELRGHRKNFQRGVRYLKTLGIKVESIGQDIKRDEEKCFHCGACTAVCPTGSLYVKRPDMEVVFDSEKCSACELCVPACPSRAMEVRFDKSLLY
ncbi:MAG TPA: NIL domain-containing protein, partial [Acidobacteriota bacterium]|nr:NIL domain-containing protein [Acidobacteriota bacterium]